jgi:dihydroorotate dehydrogenase
MLRYRHLWPVIQRLPPEFAHALGLQLLRLPVRFGAKMVQDPFTWGGLTFRNRIGMAAGFDKNGVCLRGVERLGAGFVEVGTVLVAPWKGNAVTPRLKRLIDCGGIWNRLGFTSHGLNAVAAHLAGVPRPKRNGLVVACNIGPHPGHLKAATTRDDVLAAVRQELLTLSNSLYSNADLFVVNLSSPNTPGLRSLLQDAELGSAVLLPLRRQIQQLDRQFGRAWRTPLLVKLPPEDERREPWSGESLKVLLTPLLDRDACDGFVAVNTSTRLAQKLVGVLRNPELPGGVSGGPLRGEALRVVELVRGLIGRERLLIGCGGVMAPEHAYEFLSAGADLVEVYSGMIYVGPGLIGKCAQAMQVMEPRPTGVSGRPGAAQNG